MIIHDRISLPELSLLAPDVVLPTVVSIALFAAWWVWPRRLSFGLLSGWTLLNFAVGGLVSVLPWPFLPFVPEQTIQHYVAHALYAGCQLPLLFVLFRHRPVRAWGVPRNRGACPRSGSAGRRSRGRRQGDVRSVVKPELADQLNGRRRVFEGHEVGRIGDDRR